MQNDSEQTKVQPFEFDKFVESIPQYAFPEINEQGDVIIRRKNPSPPRDLREIPLGGDSTEI